LQLISVMACSIANMMGNMTIDERSLLEDVIKKLESVGVNTREGVLRVNIQENRGSAFSSLIYDCSKKTFMKNYPFERVPESAEKKIILGNLILSYYENENLEIGPDVSGYQDCKVGYKVIWSTCTNCTFYI
jgi:hypothetical protein